jgi:hypothetical protein
MRNAFDDFLTRLIVACDENNGHLRLEDEPFLPVCVSRTYDVTLAGKEVPAYSIRHLGEQNGDIMCDPEICFGVFHGKGDTVALVPYSFRNDYVGYASNAVEPDTNGYRYDPIEQSDLVDFLHQWASNMKGQGFEQSLNEFLAAQTVKSMAV